MKPRWIAAALAALFAAYVIARAVGIWLDLNPYVTEIIAIALVAAISKWIAVARAR